MKFLAARSTVSCWRWSAWLGTQIKVTDDWIYEKVSRMTYMRTVIGLLE